MNNYYRRKNLISILCNLFIIFCLFPYLRILPFNLDAQPNALVLSIPIILILGHSKISKEIAVVFFTFIVAICLLILTNPTIIGLRTFSNYLSLFLIAYATYLSLNFLQGIPYKTFHICVWVWFSVGFIQFVISPSFLSFLTLRGEEGSMSHGRGVCSLACEPTYYGMISVFLVILNYLNFRKEKYFNQISIICIIQILLSKSSTCFLFLVLAFCIYFVFMILKGTHKLTTISYFILICAFLYYLMPIFIHSIDSRFTSVLNVLYYSPENFILMDRSVTLRFMHSFFPLKGFFDDYGLPHGLARFNDYLVPLSKNQEWGKLLPFSYEGEYRINSAIGGLLFELGIFALPFFIMVYKCFKKLYTVQSKKVIICGIVLGCMMLNNMPFSQSILPFIVGDIIYLSKHV